MNTAKKLFLGAASLVILAGLSAPAGAETIIKNTTVTQIDLPNTNKIDFKAFDLNKDGILSTGEVGEKLFYVFDNDGNHVIDNIEFNKRTVLTIIPMQAEVETMYDFDNDGKVDATKYTYATFADKSGLMRFDENHDGLTPQEFIDTAFNVLDVDHSGVVEVNEWKGAYIASLDRRNREKARYN